MIFLLNYIWSFLIIISLAISLANGTADKVCSAICEGAGEGITLALGIAGIMAFWSGIMKIAEKSGLVKLIARVFSPVTALIFPETRKDKELGGAIAMNMTANFFGMGNAATPLGINAMKSLSRYSIKGVATDSMCMLAVINSASIQLIPSTLIAIRTAMGSASPSEITVPIWIVSAVTFLTGIILCNIMRKRL